MKRSYTEFSEEENNRRLAIFKEKHKRLCAYQSTLIRRHNKYEKIVESYLIALGIRYQPQKGIITGEWNDFCIADFYLPAPWKTVVEVDGEYHNLPGQIKRDKQKDSFYRGRRFKVLRINYRQIPALTPDKLLDLLKKAR